MKRQAFTLIELLVVIAVIAILMAILMPALNLAKDQGRKMVCSNNLHSLALANQIYANAFDDWGNRFLCSNRNPVMKSSLRPSYRIIPAPSVAMAAASKATGENRRARASSTRVTYRGVKMVNSNTSGTVR